jgi:hypothetical protein
MQVPSVAERSIHFYDRLTETLCGSTESSPRFVTDMGAVTCYDCRSMLVARDEFRRAVEQLIPTARAPWELQPGEHVAP